MDEQPNYWGGTRVKNVAEHISKIWNLKELNKTEAFHDVIPADLIRDENGQEMKIKGVPLGEYFRQEPKYPYIDLDSYLQDLKKNDLNNEISFQVIGPDRKLHPLGMRMYDPIKSTTEFGYVEEPRPEPKAPTLWQRFLNLFTPQKEVQEWNTYQALQKSDIMQKCARVEAELHPQNAAEAKEAPQTQQKTAEKTAEAPQAEAVKITTPEEAREALTGNLSDPKYNKLRQNGMFQLARELNTDVHRTAQPLSENHIKAAEFGEQALISMQALEDYSKSPTGAKQNEVKEHIANVMTFGLVASDSSKQFKLLDGVSCKELSQQVAKDKAFQTLMDSYSPEPHGEKSLVSLAANVAQGRVGEISKPFRNVLTAAKQSAVQEKSAQVKTAEKTKSADEPAIKPKENVL